jgi:hypothetical protein
VRTSVVWGQAGSRGGRSHVASAAYLRILAQLLGVRYDDLRQREQQRGRRRARVRLLSATAAVLVLGGLAIFALTMRGDAQRLREAGAAEQALAAELGESWTPDQLAGAEAIIARLAALAPDRALRPGVRKESTGDSWNQHGYRRRIRRHQFLADIVDRAPRSGGPAIPHLRLRFARAPLGMTERQRDVRKKNWREIHDLH